jgi:hypothetical protein
MAKRALNGFRFDDGGLACISSVNGAGSELNGPIHSIVIGAGHHDVGLVD